MAENDNDSLIDAYVNVRADTTQAQKDILWLEKFIGQKVEKPKVVTVKPDGSIRRTTGDLQQTVDTAKKATEAISGIGRADTSRATRGIDALFGRMQKMRAEIDRATQSQERFNQTAASGGMMGRAGAMARRAAPMAARFIPGYGPMSVAASGAMSAGRAVVGAARYAAPAVGMAGSLAARGMIGAAGLAGTAAGRAHNTFDRFATGGAMAGSAMALVGGGPGASLGAGLGGGVGNALGGRAGGFVLGSAGAIGGKVIEDGLAGIDQNRKIEAGLAKIMGDAGKAKKLFSELGKIEFKVPIDMGQLGASAKALALAGYEAKEIPGRMRVIMDAATASTEGLKDGTGRIIEQIAKAKSMGGFTGKGTELKNLQGMGLPIAEILKQQFGMTIEEVASATKEGVLEVENVIDRIMESLNARFAGAVNEEINSVGGQVELLKAKYNDFASTIAEPIFDPLLDGLKELNKFLEGEAFDRFTQKMAAMAATAVESFKVLANTADSFGAKDRAETAAAAYQDGTFDTGERATGALGVLQTVMNIPNAVAEATLGMPLAVREANEAEERKRKGLPDKTIKSVYDGVGPKMVGKFNLNERRSPRQQRELEAQIKQDQLVEVGQGVFGAGKRGLSVLGGVAGDLIGQGMTYFGETTGLDTEKKRSKAWDGLVDAAVDIRNDDTLAKRKEAEKLRKQAERDEKNDKEKARERAAERKMAALQDAGSGFFDDIEDPVLRERARKSEFGISMKRDKDGRMMPSVELEKAFKESRATQTSGLDGLNRMMQGNVDAANDRKLQQDQKTLLEKIVTKLQEQIDIELKAPGDGAAVIAPG